MQDFADHQLYKSEETPPPSNADKRTRTWLIIVVAVIFLGIAGYAVRSCQQGSNSTQGETPSPPVLMEEPSGPLGGVPDPIILPELDRSDAFVRKLLGDLSSHPSLSKWLITDNLIRQFVVVVANIAEGITPAPHLSYLRPSEKFSIVKDGRSLQLDPTSYKRYDLTAEIFSSLDTVKTANLYATLKPRIDEAYLDLGSPDTMFDQILEQSIIRLLDTPILKDPVSLRRQGIGYIFANPEIENLTAAQKQYLHFGSRNMDLANRKLREIGLALGIPEGRLPTP